MNVTKMLLGKLEFIIGVTRQIMTHTLPARAGHNEPKENLCMRLIKY